MLSRKRIQRSVTTATTTTRTSRTTTDEGKATTEAVVEAVLHSMLSWHNLQSHKHTQNHASCGSSSQQKQQATCGPKKYATHAVGLSVCPFNYALMYSLSLSLSSCLFLSLPLLPPHSSCHSLYVLLLTPRLLAQGQVQASNPPKNEENQQQKITKKKGQQRLQTTWANVPHKNSCHTPRPCHFSHGRPWWILMRHFANTFLGSNSNAWLLLSAVLLMCRLPATCRMPHATCRRLTAFLPAFEKGSFLSVDMIFHDILALLLFLACCDFCGPQNTKSPGSLACLSVCRFMLFAFFVCGNLLSYFSLCKL